MADSEEWETTDVLICGCGPTGAMLSGYLGTLGMRNIVLEKETDITTDPRGIALDDEGIRLVQGLGLYEHIFTKIGSSNCHQLLINVKVAAHSYSCIDIPKTRFIGGNHQSLYTEPFLCFDTASVSRLQPFETANI